MNENIFDKLDFGPFRSLLDNDDITDISYDNNGQIWIRSLEQGSLRVEVEGATPEFVEKLAFQCSNVMGTTFNNAKPFLDAESAELRMNFVHQSIATNGIALVIRKTPAKIRLEKEKLIQEDYFTPAIHDFLIKCVQAHCNIMVAGETGSGKTEFVKYLASHTKTEEKIITIEDTLELHLDKIFPQRDIVSMKTNNVASYSDVLVTCMRQNPKWILLSEVRSAEAVSAVRNSISSGHNILSTIHADKASAIPYRLYSLMETDLDVHQFLTTIYRYIQLGVHIKAFYSKQYGKFHRELDEVAEFYVDDNNVPVSRIIYQKIFGKPIMCRPSDHLVEYIENQNIDVEDIIKDLPRELPLTQIQDVENASSDNSETTESDASGDNGVNTEVSSDVVSESTDVPLPVSSVTTEVVNPVVVPEMTVVNEGDIPVAVPEVSSEPVVEESVVTPEVSNEIPVAVAAVSNGPTVVETPVAVPEVSGDNVGEMSTSLPEISSVEVAAPLPEVSNDGVVTENSTIVPEVIVQNSVEIPVAVAEVSNEPTVVETPVLVSNDPNVVSVIDNSASMISETPPVVEASPVTSLPLVNPLDGSNVVPIAPPVTTPEVVVEQSNIVAVPEVTVPSAPVTAPLAEVSQQMVVPVPDMVNSTVISNPVIPTLARLE